MSYCKYRGSEHDVDNYSSFSYHFCHSIVLVSHLSYAFCIFISFFLTKEIFNVFSIYGVYIILFRKQIVGGEMNTFNSISDGLSPSIFCRKIQRTRPLREKMDGKFLFFSPEWAFLFLMLSFFMGHFPFFCTLTWRVQNFVSRRGEV